MLRELREFALMVAFLCVVAAAWCGFSRLVQELDRLKDAPPQARKASSQGICQAPKVNLPIALRQKNWTGSENEGSCVHASMIMLLRWNRMYSLAEYWRRTYENGEWYSSLTAKCDAHGLRWAGTNNRNDVAFLEWAIRTRRGCMVTTMQGAHMILLVGLDEQNAWLLDCNRPGEIYPKPREQFLQEWFESSSWALTVVYTPPPPPFQKGVR